jgi:hypothetical protein
MNYSGLFQWNDMEYYNKMNVTISDFGDESK